MLAQLLSLGLIMLFAIMLPGPDFALVTKNTLFHSRRAGIFTTVGIASAVLVHLSYCILGLAIIISKNLLLFNVIKYVGAGYLIYLGVMTLRAKPSSQQFGHQQSIRKKELSRRVAFRQGFLCNLLNPKATLFCLALFTVIIDPHTPTSWMIVLGGEMLLIVLAWFTFLTIILSHPKVTAVLERAEKYIAKVLGIFLVGFGVMLAFLKQ
jgi:RhtB (resistance to homoserine/threonine) family protein